ncbi:hypothetical protein [Coriobacterium glomerans]|nr:hypothetical protein [Coriobacterium glomerans]
MFNLLKADLYRMTRPKRLHGYLWRYLVWLACICALVAVAGVITSRESADIVFGDQRFSSLSQFFGMYLISTGVLQFLVCLGVLQLMLSDLKQGFIQTVIDSKRGRALYAVEKIVMAGIWTAIMELILAIALLALFIPFARYDSLISEPGIFLLWMFETWICVWALAVAFIVIASLTRNSGVSYIASLFIISGFVPSALQALSSLTEVMLSLPALSHTLAELSAWLPSSCLAVLGSGGIALVQPAVSAAGLLPGGFGTQALIVSAGWIAALSAGLLMLFRRRSI